MASKPPEEKTVLHGETSWVGSQAYGDWWEKHSAGGPSVMEADSGSDVSAPHRFRAPGMKE